MADLESIVARLSDLTVLEAAELSRMLEGHWGVSASAPTTASVVPEIVPVEAEQQTEFTVILSGIVQADKKITVIKEIRAITGLGLKEAKDFTEKAGPSQIVKESQSKDEAAAMKKRLEDAGGLVTIQ
jgi:large subunit ribosomal protein L7/L12